MTPETDKERDEARAQVEIITPHENNPVAEYFSSSNTPETDIAEYYIRGEGNFVRSDICRKLERERDEARNELEDYKASAIHSCNEECKRPMCVLRRQRREAREDAEHWKTEYLIVAARLCGKKHPRDNGIISEHEIIPKLTRERDEARKKAERYRLEANAMMLQRDELKKIVEQRILVGAEIHNKANAMDDYLANKQTNNHPLYGGDSLL